MAWKGVPQSWSDIPLELAGLVLCRLPAHVDRVRFAAVCPQWRVAAREVPRPPPLPLLALPDGTVYSLPKSEPFSLPACAGYTDACSNWLLFSQEDGCFLRDPFSNATVTLPPLSQVRVRCVGDELGSGSARMETQNAKNPTLLQVKHRPQHRFKTSLTLEVVPRSWMNEFEVFEGDFEQSQWSRVTTIGDDQVLFLQRGCCKVVCVSQYKMQGDRIFFLEDSDDDDLGNGGEDDLGNGDEDGSQYYEERLGPCKVFNIRDSKVSDPLPTVSWKRSHAHATWLFPPGQE
ncbi:hypothetical protein QOZ80_9BG0716740 [Eleusine coracana subsp. coracana]|nr:hypothetical protein QOZ80_9BG0716740 [Eleusine coracana subsp. coracana]